MNKEKFGVLYFYDENPRYHQMCQLSIQSLKQFHPDWPIEVVRTKSFKIQWWRKIYRMLTPWKKDLRYNRAGQDPRMFIEKAKALCSSPFEKTFFLDVDTIITKPMNDFKDLAESNDYIVCAIPWLKYYGLDDTMPKEFPAVNVGVMFYSEKFSEKYNYYITKYKDLLSQIAMVDQYFASLICYIHSDELRISTVPNLQIDVVDAHYHLDDDNYHWKNGLLDVCDKRIRDFHVFHYNEYKPQYTQIFNDLLKI
jgi:hypothetical protein